MQPDAMTIPPRLEHGRVVRPERTGPVFSVDPVSSTLHMRYTARRHNIVWKDDPAVRRARQCLEELLRQDSDLVWRCRLDAGMGLVSNNVLHDRAGFQDADIRPPRLLYRARYYDRIGRTGIDDLVPALRQENRLPA
jgi:hypothetical protein